MTGCEALVGAALFACLARDPDCLPPAMVPFVDDLRGIAEQETGLRPYAVRDESTHEGKFFASYGEAVRFATERDALGHKLGIGLFQITGRANWQAHGLTIATGLQPCANMRAGAEHYAGNIRTAALQLYNSGSINGAPGYAASVVRRIGGVAPDTGPMSAPIQPIRRPMPRVASPYSADTTIYVREVPNVVSVD